MTEEALKAEITEHLAQANNYLTNRIFKLRKGWENSTELEKIRAWLMEVVDLGEAVAAVYARHPPEVWERFKRFGTKGLAEQTELNKRRQKLEEFVNKNKPPMIIKSKPKKEEVDGPLQTENTA